MFKTHIKNILNHFGFRMLRTVTTSDAQYETIIPKATYAPWNTDQQFITLYGQIKDHTLVDKYRCFELYALVAQCAKLSGGSIIEIGVWRGGTGALLARRASDCGIREKVYLCDTFSGVVKAGVHDTTYKGGEHADTSKELVTCLLKKVASYANVKVLQGIFPDQTGVLVADEKFRLCHIDVDVYESAKGVVDWIWDRLVPGGMIVYDDFGFSGCSGITQYVNEQMQKNDRVVIHNLNGHAIIIKRE